MCEYCRDGKQLVDTMMYKSQGLAGIEAYIALGNTLRVEYTADTFEAISEAATCKINYCPMCGERL